MKNSFLIIIFCLSGLYGFGQKKFVPDAIGRVTNPAFQKLIKERGYTLVGVYDTVSRKPVQLYARVQKNDKWGFIDVQGKEVIAPQFTHIEDFRYGVAKVKKANGNYYLVDLKDNTVSAEYENILENYNGVAIVTSGSKEGVINLDGQLVVHLEFDNVRVYPKGILAVRDEKHSLYSYKGRLLTPTAYDRLSYYGRFLKAYRGDTFCLLNSETGKPINNEWYAGEQGILNLIPSSIDHAHIDHTVLLVSNGTHSFLIDEKGRQPGDKYEKIENSGNYYSACNGADCWLLDKTGKRVAKSRGYIWYEYGNGDVFVTRDDDGRYHYFSGTMEELDFSAYDDVSDFANGLIAVLKAGKYGFTDYKGRLIIDPVYDETHYISNANGIGAVQLNGKWGLIDSKGGVVLPFEYDDINSYGPLYYTHKDDKMGVVNDAGEEKLAPVYEDIDDLRQLRRKNQQPGWLRVQQNGKWGVVNKNLEFVVAPVYDEIIALKYGHYHAIEWIDEQLLNVKKGGNRYLVTWNGEEVIPLDGEIIDVKCQYKGVIAFTKRDGKLYLTDLYGNEQPFDAVRCE